MNTAVLNSYIRALIATALTAVVTVLNTSVDLDWKVIGTAVVAACLPVIIRALDAKDTAFGRGSK
jgi:Flp pilus assembly pilin Flp